MSDPSLFERLQGLFRTEHDNDRMLRQVNRDIRRAENTNAARADARRTQAEDRYRIQAQREAAPHRGTFENDRPLENGREPTMPRTLERYDRRAGVGTGEGLFRTPEHRMLNQMGEDKRSIPIPVGAHDTRFVSLTDVLNNARPGQDQETIRRAVRHHYNREMRVRPEVERSPPSRSSMDALHELAAATDEENLAHKRRYDARDAAEVGGNENRPERVAGDRATHDEDVIALADPLAGAGPGLYANTRGVLKHQHASAPVERIDQPEARAERRFDPRERRATEEEDLNLRRRALRAMSEGDSVSYTL